MSALIGTSSLATATAMNQASTSAKAEYLSYRAATYQSDSQMPGSIDLNAADKISSSRIVPEPSAFVTTSASGSKIWDSPLVLPSLNVPIFSATAGQVSVGSTSAFPQSAIRSTTPPTFLNRQTGSHISPPFQKLYTTSNHQVDSKAGPQNRPQSLALGFHATAEQSHIYPTLERNDSAKNAHEVISTNLHANESLMDYSTLLGQYSFMNGEDASTLNQSSCNPFQQQFNFQSFNQQRHQIPLQPGIKVPPGFQDDLSANPLNPSQSSSSSVHQRNWSSFYGTDLFSSSNSSSSTFGHSATTSSSALPDLEFIPSTSNSSIHEIRSNNDDQLYNVPPSSSNSPRVNSLNRNQSSDSAISEIANPKQLNSIIEQLTSRIQSKKLLLASLQQDIESDELLISRLCTTFASAQSDSIPIPGKNDITHRHEFPPGRTVTLNDSCPPSPPDLICRKWNQGECYKGSHCNYLHQCSICNELHPKLKCISAISQSDALRIESSSSVSASVSEFKTAEICIKWNHKECPWNEKCHRKHVCLHCELQHRIVECPTVPIQFDDSICMNWNEGRCRMGERCKRDHRCSSCGSDKHQSIRCGSSDTSSDSRGEVQSNSGSLPNLTLHQRRFDDICLNWNNGRCSFDPTLCKRDHRCSFCNSQNHPAICCVIAKSASDLLRAGVDTCWNWNLGCCEDVVHPPVSVELDMHPLVGKCKRIHACSQCYSSEHSSNFCKDTTPSASISIISNNSNLPSSASLRHKQLSTERRSISTPSEPNRQKLMEICINWNQDKCKLGNRCKRIHICDHCHSSLHMSSKCDAPIVNARNSGSTVGALTLAFANSFNM